jgi:hypothetical protein
VSSGKVNRYSSEDDLAGSGRGLIQVVSRHLHTGTEGNA